MENNKIITKDYFESKVTIIIDKDKAVWFKGCDVATILGYGNSREAMKKHIDMEDKKKMNELMPSRNGTPLNSQPHTTYINESGLYSLMFGSRMENAKKFKRWITKEVLPSIRETGSYSVKKEIDDVQLKLREIQFKEYVLLMEQGNCAKLKQAYYDRLYTELSGKTLTDKSKEYSRDIVTILKEEFNKVVDFTVASSIGKHIAKQYRLKYNKDPEKYMKFVNGNNRPVFCYTKEEEKDLIHWISKYLS
jgi:prophage antirepressor-like protein